MRNHEFDQIRGFIDTNSDFARLKGYAFKRCTIRNLNTGSLIETIRLVTIGEPDSWSVEEARKRYDLPPGKGRRERYIAPATLLAALKELRNGTV